MTETKVVSIVCPGHSGSTLLDMVLGTLPKVVSSGEMVYIPWKIYKENHPEKYQTTYCSCGETMKNCNFWSPILKRSSKKIGFDILQKPEKFNISINRPYYYGRNVKLTVLRKLMTLGSIFININYIIKFLTNFYLRSIKANWLLFDTISEVSDKKIIVDSTKDIYRYLFLRNYRKTNIKLIILIRDVYGVASSAHHGLTEQRIKSVAKGWLNFYNVRLYRVIKNLDKSEYLVISYEELAKNVNATRNKIGEFLNITDPIQDISSVYPSKMHIVAGNPLRNKDKMEVRYDERWKERLSKEQINELAKINNRLSDIYSIENYTAPNEKSN